MKTIIFCITMVISTYLILYFESRKVLTTVNCSSFKFQEDAQRAFEKNTESLSRLDRDKNGVACQSNKHKPK